MSRSRLAAFLVFASLALPAAFAFGDVITQDVAECREKKAGDACMNGQGACAKSRCSRLDYSQGSPPRGSIEYDCMRCTPGLKPTSTAAVPKKSHSCAATPDAGPFGLAAALFALAATVVAARALRRRTSPTRR